MEMKRSGTGWKVPLPSKPVGVDNDDDLLPETQEAEERPKIVELGPELQRILQVPRRPIPDPESDEAVALAASLTERFRLVPVAELQPGPLTGVQALALREAWIAQGGFFPIGVGHGKSLLSFLLATLFNRPTLYLCKGDGVGDTHAKFALYRKNWKSLPMGMLQVWSYELLSNSSSAGYHIPATNVTVPGRLEKHRPKLVIVDEGHMAANVSAAVSKRLRDYLEGDNPDVVFVYMSGTPYPSGSINDARHLMKWALRDKSPLPTNFKEGQAWAGALDAKAGLMGRVDPGALVHLARQQAPAGSVPFSVNMASARRAVGIRILETPGVIGTQEPPVEIPLRIEATYPTDECPDLVNHFETLRSTWELPDGSAIASPKDMARHEKTLSLGYWTRMTPPPPPEWRQARNAWSKFCRRALKNNRRKIYSEALLKSAIKKGQFVSGAHVLHEWETQRELERKRTGLREPNTECVWESLEMIESVGDWLDAHQGVIWVEHIGVGERLRDEFKIPYYGAGGGLDVKSGRNVRDHQGGPAICSVKACGTGKNLQGFWFENLWLGVPPSEQSLARTHRPGQKAPVVYNWVYLGCARHLEGFNTAKDVKAAFASELTLSDQKLSFADIDVPNIFELAADRPGIRWSARELLDDEIPD